jgi:hypothetical protein
MLDQIEQTYEDAKKELKNKRISEDAFSNYSVDTISNLSN